jgi:hypothetical protein
VRLVSSTQPEAIITWLDDAAAVESLTSSISAILLWLLIGNVFDNRQGRKRNAIIERKSRALRPLGRQKINGNWQKNDVA